MSRAIMYQIAIALVALFFIASFFNSGWYTSHDGIFHLIRSEEAAKMLKSGHFPLRWAGNLDQGFGIPLFNFIYPLPYYLSGFLTLYFETWWAVKLVMIVAYIAGGLGVYRLIEKNSLLAFWLAIFYLVTPYQLLNLHVRAALGEIVALGIAPWVFVAYQHMTKKGINSLRWFHPLPLALVLLSHNFLGVITAIFYFLYILGDYKKVSRPLKSFALSLALASFFLLPMIIERSNLYSMTEGLYTFHYHEHFVALRQLIASDWGYGFSIPGLGDQLSFQVGITQLLLVVIALVAAKHFNLRLIILGVVYFLSIFLMTQHSSMVWSLITPLQYLQFPWRLLFVTTIAAPLIIGNVLRHNKQFWLMATIVVLTLASLYQSLSYRLPGKHLNNSEYTDLYQANVDGTTTAARIEVLPKWVSDNLRYKTDDILIESENITLSDVKIAPNSLSFKAVNNERVGEIQILRNYYPMWQLKINGKVSKANLGVKKDGTIRVTLEPGEATYEVRITSTNTQKLANVISLLAIATILFMFYTEMLRRGK